MSGETGYRIEDLWPSPPRRARGRPHQSYKEAIDLRIAYRADESYRWGGGSIAPMKAVRQAVDEPWEGAKLARLPDGGAVDARGRLGSTKEQVVRRVRDRFKPRKHHGQVAIPSELDGTALWQALAAESPVSRGRGFSFGGLRALQAKKGKSPPWIRKHRK